MLFRSWQEQQKQHSEAVHGYLDDKKSRNASMRGPRSLLWLICYFTFEFNDLKGILTTKKMAFSHLHAALQEENAGPLVESHQAAFSDAMSMTKRYFTSLLSMRS